MTQTLHGIPMPDAERAADLLMGLFDAVGDGCHTLTVSVAGDARSLASMVPFHNQGDATTVDEEAALHLMALLALTSGRVGGAVVRTLYGGGKSRVLGWRLSGCTAVPLGRAEIFSAYCTDAATGEPIAPESGVEYADAPPVWI